jgi:hypothetical protein
MFSTKIFFSLMFILSSNSNADENAFDRTIRTLNKEFRTYQVTRKLTSDEKIAAFKFEYPIQGLETDSRQNLRGVTVYIHESGRIVFVKPIAVENPLPDQKVINKVINSSENISEALMRYNFSKLGDVQKFGLLNKFATAILARHSNTKLNFDLTKEQIIEVNKLFESKVKVPDQPDIKLIEKFSREVIQFALY